MIVCICRRISDRDIARHARAGMGFDEIQFELGVGLQCGSCEGCARDVVDQCNVSQPVAALRRDLGLDEKNSAPIQLTRRITESRAWNRSQHSLAA
ncbi:MAG: (2Fe-2S)-binding protein [Pseudomonadota bacterium]